MKAKISLLILFVLIFFFISCDSGYKRAYIISKSDDKNWTTFAIIECDSFTMVSENECTFWVDGRKATLKGKLIKVFTNTNYKP